jgi:Helix-turn-helix domain
LLIVTTDEETGAPGTAALRLRALAHPVRWKMIDVVTSERSATATRCAEVTGESVASCSYHLGILGKYGYLEQVPGTAGREKPWQATSALQGDLSPSEDDAEAGLAVEAAAFAFIEHEMERTKSRLRRSDLEPPGWRNTNLVGGSTMYVTESELSAIKADLIALMHRYADRDFDPALRPADARLARVFISSGVEPTRMPRNDDEKASRS